MTGLLEALARDAGPVRFAAPDATLTAHAERWAKYARTGCSHLGPRMASLAERPVWCIGCAISRGHLLRWATAPTCTTCGRHIGDGEREVLVLALGDLQLIAAVGPCCSHEPTTERNDT